MVCQMFVASLLSDVQMVGKLYLDAATLTWNGNAVAGKDNVLKFLEDIPECAHSVDGYDAQPVARMSCVQCTGWFAGLKHIARYQKNPVGFIGQTHQKYSLRNPTQETDLKFIEFFCSTTDKVFYYS